MMKNRGVNFGTPAIAVLATLLIAGCGAGQGSATYPVSGTVMYEGEPMVGGGTIRFVPVGDQGGKPAGGTIGKDGTYTLSTYGNSDGAVAGKHRVELSQNRVLEPAKFPEASEGEEEEEVDPISEAKYVPDDQQIPKVYSGSESPMTVVVEEKDQNTIDIELESNPETGGS